MKDRNGSIEVDHKVKADLSIECVCGGTASPVSDSWERWCLRCGRLYIKTEGSVSTFVPIFTTEREKEVAGRTERQLIEGAIRNSGHRRRDREQIKLGHAVRDAFGIGSTSAEALCRSFGYDPDGPCYPVVHNLKGEVATEWQSFPQTSTS